jgi:hypothetical protein
VQALRRVARPEDLTAAADTLHDRHPWLSELLRRAAFPQM